MFRQINVHSIDQDLQRILWRTESSYAIQEYRLTTVTYETAPAPYLAIRTLRQLAHDENTRFLLGASALLENTYVDDILSGGDILPQAQEARRQLVGILSTGGFKLSKWAANELTLCPDDQVSERLFADSEGVSTLGVLWSACRDIFYL